MALRYQKPSWPPGQRQTDSHCCCLYREFVFPVRPRKQIQRRNPPDNGEIHQLLEIHFIPRIRTVLFNHLNGVARDLLNQFNIAVSLYVRGNEFEGCLDSFTRILGIPRDMLGCHESSCLLVSTPMFVDCGRGFVQQLPLVPITRS
jgi:hypothetical protein